MTADSIIKIGFILFFGAGLLSIFGFLWAMTEDFILARVAVAVMGLGVGAMAIGLMFA